MLRPAIYRVRCRRRATAAAAITFITSAKKNGASPKATARCQLRVITASHVIPETKSTSSAVTPAIKFRQNYVVPRSEIHPAIHATTGYANK